MKVRELIERLKEFDSEDEIIVGGPEFFYEILDIDYDDAVDNKILIEVA